MAASRSRARTHRRSKTQPSSTVASRAPDTPGEWSGPTARPTRSPPSTHTTSPARDGWNAQMETMSGNSAKWHQSRNQYSSFRERPKPQRLPVHTKIQARLLAIRWDRHSSRLPFPVRPDPHCPVLQSHSLSAINDRPRVAQFLQHPISQLPLLPLGRKDPSPLGS